MSGALIDMADTWAKAQVDRLSSIMVLMGTQSAQTAIEKFSGEPKKFQSWVKSIEKYILVVNGDAEVRKPFHFSQQRVHEVTARKADKQYSCYKCGEAGHTLAFCPNRGNQNNRGRCWLCGQVGHRQSECPRNARSENKECGRPSRQSNGQALA